MAQRLSKQAAQYRHAIRRASERYGLQLNKARYLDLCHQIRDSKAEFVGRQSKRITVWRLVVDGKSCAVVYDKARHQIVTFLPPGITDAKGVSLSEEKEAVDG